MDIKASKLSRQGLFWIFLTGFYLAWALAWIFRLGWLERVTGGWFQDPNHDTIYWTLLKFLLWLAAPAVYLGSLYGVGLWEYLGLSRFWKKGMVWGASLAVVMGCLYLPYYHRLGILNQVPAPVLILGPFLNAVLVSPLVEEVFFRGFVTRQLQGWWKSFLLVNLAAALAFALIHWVGWYFQGTLFTHGSLRYTRDLVLFGFVLGYANRFTGSLWTSLLLHMANNLYASRFWTYF